MKNHSAGLALIYKDKILLVHPTKASWRKTYGIPKGKLEKGETALDAAIRETKEEIGFKAKRKRLKEEDVRTFYYVNSAGKRTKLISFWFYQLTEREYDELSDFRGAVNKDKLSLKEIDWAGFVTLKTAETIILPNQKYITKEALKWTR